MTGEGGLDARIRTRLGELDLDVVLRVHGGETVALLGPNGAGKTTVLRTIAGLHPIDDGRIVVDGTVLDEPATRRFVPPQRRNVAVVFQDHLLFPSMTAVENVAFGLRARGVDRTLARSRATELLEAVGLSDHRLDRPDALSGGQSQRVALARALAVEPAVLLLDEPLAALDATTRPHVRRDLRRHLDDLTTGARLVVTHDPVDAFALAERVVVLEHGTVTHDGRLADVAARPRSPYVADLVGVNLYEGEARAGTVDVRERGVRVVCATDVAGPVFAVVHPRAIAVHRTEPSGSPRNVWAAVVADVDVERDRARVRVDRPLPMTAEITSAAAVELALRAGDEVWLSVKATEVEVYER